MTWTSIRPIAIGVPLVLGAWFVALVAITFVQPAGKPVAVLSRDGLMGAVAAVVAADGAILQVRGDTVIAISDAPGFVPRLYQAGAMLVVASSAGGCIVAPPSGPVRAPVVPPRPAAEDALPSA